MMAVAFAKERGFPIDDALLATQVQKTVSDPVAALERLIVGEASSNESIGISYRHVGVASAGGPIGPNSPLVVHMLAGKQHISGRWSSNSHRPPLEDSPFTATAITIRALQLLTPPSESAGLDVRIERARKWLEATPAITTEEQTMQILGLRWAGAGGPQLTRLAAALKDRQRPDGGWAQIPTRDSDAYATGQVLIALHVADRLPVSDPAYRRGIGFLLATQADDGSWLVPTRRARGEGLPYFESGFPYSKHQFISYAGSAWGTMALVLGSSSGSMNVLAGSRQALLGSPLVPQPSQIADLPLLIRAALLSSVADVKARLATGDDPNGSTAQGVTPLMSAVHDEAKVKVLLAAGARPSTASRSGHTALIVAAGYNGAEQSVQALLDAGADVHAATTLGVIGGSTPLVRAVMRGDPVVARMLLERGARLSGSATHATPLHVAVWHGDVEMATFLIDRGAAVDERWQFSGAGGGSVGGTALMTAAEDGHPQLVQLLLARGADANARDANGLTPLMIAASAADSGRTEIIEALLAAGADPRAMTGDGVTAQALAEKYSHAAALRALNAVSRK